jgi:hypothetical protein
MTHYICRCFRKSAEDGIGDRRELFVAGAIGGAATVVSTIQNIQNHNYAAVAFSVGSLGGSFAVGGLTGGAVGDAINPPATRGFWSFGRDRANLFKIGKGLDLGC